MDIGGWKTSNHSSERGLRLAQRLQVARMVYVASKSGYGWILYPSAFPKNVKKGQKEKLFQGWLPSKPPLGYKTVGEKGHKIHVIDPDKAPLIKKMFDLYGSNRYSTKKLADVIFQEGLRSRGGNKVSHSRVHQLLGDPFYYGMNRWNNKITKGGHEPLITKELYMRCQEIMHSNGTPRYYKHNSLFKNVFRCAECGGRITWEAHKVLGLGILYHYKNCQQRDWVKQENIDIQEFYNQRFKPKRCWGDRKHALLGPRGFERKPWRGNRIPRKGYRRAQSPIWKMVTIRLDKLYDDNRRKD